MQKYILAIASAELQFAKKMENFRRNTNDTNFTSGVLTGTHNFLFDFAFCFCYGIFNTGWINATIFHEAFERIAGNLTANWVKAT